MATVTDMVAGEPPSERSCDTTGAVVATGVVALS
jgi:hypothetical protein